MNRGKSSPARTIQAVTTVALRPEGPTRVARISYFSPNSLVCPAVAASDSAIVRRSFCRTDGPVYLRVAESIEEGCLEATDRVRRRQQVVAHLGRVDNRSFPPRQIHGRVRTARRLVVRAISSATMRPMAVRRCPRRLRQDR